MAESFISAFRLMGYLDELKKNEFMKFKELLQQETVQHGLQPIPWVLWWKANPRELASLMEECYGEQPAWDVALCIFPKIHRKDLCDKASRESAANAYRAHIQKKFISMWSRGAFTEIPGCFDQTLTREDHESLEETEVADGDQLAGLISRERPDDTVPLADIVAQAERILFIIHSLEELQCTLTEPESELCRDWREEGSVKTVLSSVLRRKILPESALLLAAIPGCPEGLENKLDHPNMQELKCFQDSHVKQYFCCSFEDRGQAMAALSLVQNNEHLFTMCHVPLLCWMVCTSLKQEVERGSDLAATCCRSTSVFLFFMFLAFTPKGAIRPSQQGQGLLKALCSLAAEGMWTDTWVFGEEELRRNGIADTDIPTLLDLRLFRKHSESGSSYSFIHMHMQEFCAAMFYLLDSPRDHPSRARSRELASQLLGCLRILVEIEDPEDQVEFLLLFYALFEVQSDAFASHLMSSLHEAHFPLRERPDLAVAAYCLKYCSSLRELTVSVPEIFPEEGGPDPILSKVLVDGARVLSVHGSSPGEPVASSSSLAFPSYTGLLTKAATRTVLRKEADLPGARSHRGDHRQAFTLRCRRWVFTSNPNLQHLSMTCIQLTQDDVSLLCSALSNPVCNLQELLLQRCEITPRGCQDLAFVLASNLNLRILKIGGNNIGDAGVKLLSKALLHPDCSLKELRLDSCKLTRACCEDLASVIAHSQTLHELDVTSNALSHGGVMLLCEAVRGPKCVLRKLRTKAIPGSYRPPASRKEPVDLKLCSPPPQCAVLLL
ncbi:NACHT, LRR and PYD domains-containing protein 4-like [Urocitellus parryii]